MKTNNMKNMIILRDIQSNIIEEAYVVLKENVKIHNFQKVDKHEKINKDLKKDKTGEKEYVIKEAQMIIKDYISEIENKEDKNGGEKLRKKYKKMRALTIFLTIFSILSIIKIFLK